MDKRLLFNENILNYDKSRPRYCTELFSDIINHAELGSGKSCLEIGCGTGQATEPILKTGSSVIAIELGDKFAEYVKNKFESFTNFRVVNMDFENYSSDEKFDLIYSATAFHWIKEEIGYPKVFNMLKSGGTLALFWNRTRPNTDPVHEKIDEIYKKYGDYINYVDKNTLVQDDNELYENIKNTIMRYGFIEVEFHLYRGTRTFNADGYISVLNTYPNHIAIPEPVRSKFYAEIKVLYIAMIIP